MSKVSPTKVFRNEEIIIAIGIELREIGVIAATLITTIFNESRLLIQIIESPVIERTSSVGDGVAICEAYHLCLNAMSE
jgi:hypothetical protein